MKGLFHCQKEWQIACVCAEKNVRNWQTVTEGRGQEHGKDGHNLYSVMKITVAGIYQSAEWLGMELDTWGPRFNYRQWKDFLFTKESSLGSWHTEPRMRKIPAALYHGVMRYGCEVGHSPSSSTKVGNKFFLYSLDRASLDCGNLIYN